MSSKQPAKILLVEDDPRLANLVTTYLTEQGFEMTTRDNGDRLSRDIEHLHPDLIILDVVLPGKDGFEVCRELRLKYLGPILMLTARSSDIDQVLGLELGADDYLIKPVEPRLLLARVNALLRRTGWADGGNLSLHFGGLDVDMTNREVILHKKRIELSTSEFDLLAILCRQAGDVLTREYLYQEILRRSYDGLDRTIDVRISHLRKKLGDDADKPFRIKTIWGRGYLLVKDAWE